MKQVKGKLVMCCVERRRKQEDLPMKPNESEETYRKGALSSCGMKVSPSMKVEKSVLEKPSRL